MPQWVEIPTATAILKHVFAKFQITGEKETYQISRERRLWGQREKKREKREGKGKKGNGKEGIQGEEEGRNKTVSGRLQREGGI